MIERIYVKSRKDAERRDNLIFTPHLWIAIRDPGSDRVKVRRNSHTVRVVDIAFDDIDPTKYPTLADGMMTEEQAAFLWNTLDTCRAPVLVVSCEMGLSRSATVAEVFQQDLGDRVEIVSERNRYRNGHIYRTMRAVRGLDKKPLDGDNSYTV